MKTLRLLLLLWCVPGLAGAQELDLHEGALIESAEIQGIAPDRLSADLRREIQGLSDQRVSRARVAALVARIEGECPDVVAAARDVLRPDGRVRIIFLVAPIGDDQELSSNINSRYLVERVDVTGIDETKISQALRDKLQALVGANLDPTKAEALSDELEAEFPKYHVTRRISRGSEVGKIVVTFQFERSERDHWIPFSPSRAKMLFHEDLRWTFVFDLRFTPGNYLFAFGYTPENKDDLIEEYEGYWIRFETRKAGTRRLGLSFEFSDFDQKWKDVTRSAVAVTPGIPSLYDHRRTAQPAVTFAVSPRLRFGAGANITQLDLLGAPGVSQQANAVTGSADFDQSWRPESGGRMRLSGGYEYRGGTRSLGSDLVYGRHFAQARYIFEQHHSRVRADLLVGGASGQPPMFERFSLGDSLTLRGWNKFDIAPAGANRMWHQSIEYAYRNFAYFLDAGSVWDHGVDAKVRLSTGVGYHHENWFVTFGVPLNSDHTDVKFMIGFRALGASIDKR